MNGCPLSAAIVVLVAGVLTGDIGFLFEMITMMIKKSIRVFCLQ
jgi:hypothetical protein